MLLIWLLIGLALLLLLIWLLVEINS
jgi:hypothetical protein